MENSRAVQLASDYRSHGVLRIQRLIGIIKQQNNMKNSCTVRPEYIHIIISAYRTRPIAEHFKGDSRNNKETNDSVQIYREAKVTRNSKNFQPQWGLHNGVGGRFW